MFQDKYVFSQLTAFLNRTQFNNYVRKYDGNRYVKHLDVYKRQIYTDAVFKDGNKQEERLEDGIRDSPE